MIRTALRLALALACVAALEALLTKRDPGPRRKHGNIPL
jgi:hypothetical protein